MTKQYNKFMIRNATTKDSLLLSSWWNNGKLMEHAGFPNGTGQTPDSIVSSILKDSDNTHRRLIIEINSHPIGEMNYRNMGNKTAEIGIKICESSQQEKGHGRVFLSMLIGELFLMGYNKIILDTSLNNTRAQHVYELLGFTKLKVNYNSWKNQLGELQSSVDYELYENQFVNYAN
ncbi:MAG: GNAT family N-acetyltransferase [Anaerocolumna sp.]